MTSYHCPGCTCELSDLDTLEMRHHRNPTAAEAKALAMQALPRSGIVARKVLDAVAFSHDGLSSTQISELTGIYYLTVVPAVSRLKQGNWLIESGRERKTERNGDEAIYVLTDKAIEEL